MKQLYKNLNDQKKQLFKNSIGLIAEKCDFNLNYFNGRLSISKKGLSFNLEYNDGILDFCLKKNVYLHYFDQFFHLLIELDEEIEKMTNSISSMNKSLNDDLECDYILK